MNAVKCPNCGNLNSTNENYCLNCGTSILNLQPPTYSPLASQQNQAFKSYGFNVPANFNAAQYENP
ncbi:MAG: zinc-ribbon domain-containing protein, partial [Pyrinomonadaceae bacterium]